jgi:predicted nucleic acid-binding protein
VTVTAVYDACVLYPAPVRDLLVHLATLDVVRARWTDAIHDEWIRNVLADRADLTRVQLERTRTLVNAHVRDCLVTGYEDRIPTLTLPDPDDRHILAAAVHGGATVIVTFNLKDFPPAVLTPLAVEAVHPDEFVSRLLAEQPELVCEAVRRQRANLKWPPKTVEEFLLVLEHCGLTRTVVRLSADADRI